MPWDPSQPGATAQPDNQTGFTGPEVSEGGSVSTVLGTLTATGGATAYLTFSAIPQTYTHLQIVGKVRSNRAQPVDILALRVNEVASSGYNYRYVINTGSGSATPYADSLTGVDKAEIGYMPSDGTAGDEFGTVTLDLPFYTESGTRKNYSGKSAFTGLTGDFFGSGVSDPVTSVTLMPRLGTAFTAGTTFTLIGVK